METILTTVHYVLCFFLIAIILLQKGKGADIGAAFGGASQTVFGSRGPITFLNKMTAFVAGGFIVTSIWLAQMAKTATVETVFDKTVTSETKSVVPDADKPLMDLKKEVEGSPKTDVEKK